MKHDTGKAPIARGFTRYFPRAVEAVAFISLFGFEKYKEWGGWKKVPDAFNRYDDALGRHDLGMQKGETNCPESGKLHIAHRAWNALATLELYLIEQEKEQERNDASWIDVPLAQWRADKFTLLHQDAMARMQGKNMDGSPRRETFLVNDAGGDAPAMEPAEPLRTCRDCKCWSACSRLGECIGAQASRD
jgi:hypothetical protein